MGRQGSVAVQSAIGTRLVVASALASAKRPGRAVDGGFRCYQSVTFYRLGGQTACRKCSSQGRFKEKYSSFPLEGTLPGLGQSGETTLEERKSVFASPVGHINYPGGRVQGF